VSNMPMELYKFFEERAIEAGIDIPASQLHSQNRH